MLSASSQWGRCSSLVWRPWTSSRASSRTMRSTAVPLPMCRTSARSPPLYSRWAFKAPPHHIAPHYSTPHTSLQHTTHLTTAHHTSLRHTTPHYSTPHTPHYSTPHLTTSHLTHLTHHTSHTSYLTAATQGPWLSLLPFAAVCGVRASLNAPSLSGRAQFPLWWGSDSRKLQLSVRCVWWCGHLPLLSTGRPARAPTALQWLHVSPDVVLPTHIHRQCARLTAVLPWWSVLGSAHCWVLSTTVCALVCVSAGSGRGSATGSPVLGQKEVSSTEHT